MSMIHTMRRMKKKYFLWNHKKTIRQPKGITQHRKTTEVVIVRPPSTHRCTVDFRFSFYLCKFLCSWFAIPSRLHHAFLWLTRRLFNFVIMNRMRPERSSHKHNWYTFGSFVVSIANVRSASYSFKPKLHDDNTTSVINFVVLWFLISRLRVRSLLVRARLCVSIAFAHT